MFPIQIWSFLAAYLILRPIKMTPPRLKGVDETRNWSVSSGALSACDFGYFGYPKCIGIRGKWLRNVLLPNVCNFGWTVMLLPGTSLEAFGHLSQRAWPRALGLCLKFHSRKPPIVVWIQLTLAASGSPHLSSRPFHKCLIELVDVLQSELLKQKSPTIDLTKTSVRPKGWNMALIHPPLSWCSVYLQAGTIQLRFASRGADYAIKTRASRINSACEMNKSWTAQTHSEPTAQHHKDPGRVIEHVCPKNVMASSPCSIIFPVFPSIFPIKTDQKNCWVSPGFPWPGTPHTPRAKGIQGDPRGMICICPSEGQTHGPELGRTPRRLGEFLPANSTSVELTVTVSAGAKLCQFHVIWSMLMILLMVFWYYFDGIWCYFDGIWCYFDGIWCYFDGIWWYFDGNWCYFDGIWWYVDGIWWYFDGMLCSYFDCLFLSWCYICYRVKLWSMRTPIISMILMTQSQISVAFCT